MTRMTHQEAQDFLADLHVGVLSLTDDSRGPLTVPIWYDYQPEGDIFFITGPNSRKGKLLKVGVRLSLVAQSEDPPYRYVSVEGPVTSISKANKDDLLDMAMVPSYGHHDAIPNSHPNYIGPPGGRGSGEAHEAMDRADVILALGTKINQASSSWDYSVINQETKIIQVDIDPIEIGRNYPVSVGIVGDAQRVAQQLIEAVSVKAADGKANDAWKSEFQSIANKRIQRLESEKALSANPMMPQQVYPELAKALPKGAMVTIDAGVAPGLAYDRVFFEEPRTMFNYAGQGALGMGFSVGLGTKLGRPDRTAVSLHGDGGFLYTCGELNTAVRHNIPSVSIVLNNSCMGAEKSQQKALHNEKYVGVDLENPRFDKLAEVFGAKGYYAEHPSEIADTVAEAVKSNAPAVIEIPVQEYFPPSAPTPR